MEFPSSGSLGSPLTPQQLTELHFLQHGSKELGQGEEYYKSQVANDGDINMNTNPNPISINAESIFWENNYTPHHLDGLSDAKSSISGSISSPSVESQVDQYRMNAPSQVQQQQQQQQQEQQQQQPQSDVSEEELYLRRKAQNRALQRLFRERKESKLKDLSTKLSKTELEKERLLKELENLRKQNTVLLTENQVLLKSGSITTSSSSPVATDLLDNVEFSFPINKKMFISDLVSNTEHDLKKAYTYDTLIYQHEGNKMLSVGAVWDYLHQYSSNHEELEIDIGKVMNYLKGSEKCHGYGPGFSIDVVKALIANVTGEKIV